MVALQCGIPHKSGPKGTGGALCRGLKGLDRPAATVPVVAEWQNKKPGLHTDYQARSYQAQAMGHVGPAQMPLSPSLVEQIPAPRLLQNHSNCTAVHDSYLFCW